MYSNKNKFIKANIILFFILKPFYMWDSGLPQISDLIFAIFILVTPWKYKEVEMKNNKYILLFVCYTSIINFFYIIKVNYDYTRFLFSTSFIVFLGLGYIKIYKVLKYKKDFFEIFYWSSILTTFIQIIIALFYSSGKKRETLFFNNPNQLGYFFLLNATIFILISIAQKKYEKQKIITIIMPLFNFVLIILSQSRAAIASMLFLIIYYFYKIKFFSYKNLRKIFTIIFFVSFILISGEKSEKFHFFKIIEKRIETASKKKDGSMAGRGYDRIYIYPEYLLFGSGEGGFKRYTDEKIFHYGEIHSLLGNILFSYGLIGLLLFLGIFNKLVKYNNKSYLILLLPIFIYNLTHNGLRNQLFWISLCLINLLLEKNKKKGKL